MKLIRRAEQAPARLPGPGAAVGQGDRRQDGQEVSRAAAEADGEPGEDVDCDLPPPGESGLDVMIEAILTQGDASWRSGGGTRPGRPSPASARPRFKMTVGASPKRARMDPAITEQIDYRWLEEYAGMRLDRARRVERIDGEDMRLERLLADAEVGEAIPKEDASGRYQVRRGVSGRSGNCAPSSTRAASRNVGRARSRGSPDRRRCAHASRPATSRG